MYYGAKVSRAFNPGMIISIVAMFAAKMSSKVVQLMHKSTTYSKCCQPYRG